MNRSLYRTACVLLFTVSSVFILCGQKQGEVNTEDGTAVEKMNRNGLSRVSGEISALLRPSVKLVTIKSDEKKIKKGATKIGGRPDVPAGFRWPSWKKAPMSFIAQLNCAEIKAVCADIPLPSSGIIYFFYDSKQETWGFDPRDRGSWRVVYADCNASTLSRMDFPVGLPDDGRFAGCGVKIVKEISWPSPDSIQLEKIKLKGHEKDAYYGLVESMGKERITLNKVWGHADPVQNSMEGDCEYASRGIYTGDGSEHRNPLSSVVEKEAFNWRLLLQVDSDENSSMMWGDSGCLYFWIKEKDLAEKNFSRTWVVLQCY